MKSNKLLLGTTLLSTILLLSGCKDIVLLDPKGPIGAADLHLIIVSFVLMLLVVVPVIIMALWFPFKYRATNKKAEYTPKWSHSTKIEVVVWVVPAIIVGILSVLTWRDTHRLDPFEPIQSSVKPVTIEAVSMNWKWLFIYPEQHIATVNHLVLPVDVPVKFKLTSDTVVTSFFIPQLGSQIYAMGGKQSQLHLLANATGDYFGQNNQYSGDGFADMKFDVKVTTPQDYEAWVQKIKQSPDKLDLAQLAKMRKPAVGYPIKEFSSVKPDIFKDIVAQYAMPNSVACKTPTKPGVVATDAKPEVTTSPKVTTSEAKSKVTTPEAKSKVITPETKPKVITSEAKSQVILSEAK